MWAEFALAPATQCARGPMASACRWQVPQAHPDLHKGSVRLTSARGRARAACWSGLGCGPRGARDGGTGFSSPGSPGFPQGPGRPLRTGVRKRPCSACIREEDVDFRDPRLGFLHGLHPHAPGRNLDVSQNPSLSRPSNPGLVTKPWGHSLLPLAWMTLSGPRGLLSSRPAFPKPSCTWQPE